MILKYRTNTQTFYWFSHLKVDLETMKYEEEQQASIVALRDQQRKVIKT